MNETKNYKFPKPEENDFYNIEDFNKAMDILDETLEDMEGKKLDKKGDASDVVTEFEQEILRENLESGEKLAVSLGKIKKWFSELRNVAFSGRALDVAEDAAHHFVSDTEKGNWNGKVSAEGGDISNTKIESLDNITEEFPEPEEGETPKVFLGKVRKFIEDFHDFKSRIITVGKLVNNGYTTAEGNALDARYGKTLYELYSRLDSKFLYSDMIINVATTGSDETGDGSSTAPYATITKALSVIPKNLNGYEATIQIADGTYDEDVIITGFKSGAFTIQSNSVDAFNDNCIIKSLMIHSCTGNMNIKSLTMQESIDQIPVQVVFVYSCSIYYVKCNMSNTNGSGISVWGAEAHISYCDISNHNEAIIAQRNSKVYSWNNIGTNNQTGLLTASGSSINIGSSIQPNGQNMITNYEGVIIKGSSVVGSLGNSVTCYVATTGSDITGDGTESNPFATIQRAIDILPKDLNGHNVDIHIADGTYNENVSIVSFHGSSISLFSSDTEHLSEVCNVNSVGVGGCTSRIHFYGINFTRADGPAIDANGCKDLYFQYCQVNALSDYKAFIFTCCTNVRLGGCKSQNHKVVLACYNSMVYSSDWAENSAAAINGLVVAEGGTIYKKGNQPIGWVSNENHYNAGQLISPNGTQISNLITSGLSCTWGTISGGYVRHGLSEAAMITIQIRVDTTVELKPYNDYYINGFPSSSIGIAVTCSWAERVNGCYCDNGAIYFQTNGSVPIDKGSILMFNCTYFTNS